MRLTALHATVERCRNGATISDWSDVTALPKGMLVIGLTGGIGSGKSTVGAEFARLGIPVLSADEIAKSLCESEEAIRRKLTKLLGPETYAPDGKYNRSFVASRIFQDSSLKAKVESVIHPRTEREIAARSKQLHSKGHSLALVEAALVFEAGMDEWLHSVLFVDADEQIRVERLRSRGILTDDEIRLRIRSQGSSAEHAKLADYIIKNNGTLTELQERVQFFATLFRSLAQIQSS